MLHNDMSFSDEKKREILFIGEKNQSHLALSGILEENYRVLFVHGEDKASETPSLIIIDLDEAGARQRLKEFKHRYVLQAVPFLILSSDPKIEERYHYLGADGFLHKSITDKRLILARVSRAILSAENKKEIYVSDHVYSYDPDKEVSLRLLKDFEMALRNEEFEVWYQPKFNIKEKMPVLSSAEALVRWKHPVYGYVAPGDFIPLLEEYERIFDLDLYVWNKAAKQIDTWKKELKIFVPVSVNVSRIDMKNEKLADKLLEITASHEIKPQDLLLEITESAYMEDPERIIDQVKKLRDCGFLIEMDDFGTGYSSLAMVSKLPIDALKIDMRFIREAFKGKTDTRMIEIIIEIASYLKVLTVAEGVEDDKQLSHLKRVGCDIVQGYYFSKPVPAKDFGCFLEEKLELMS